MGRGRSDRLAVRRARRPAPPNGKYLATLACATCHTVTVSSANPLHIDATKAFQGGKVVNTTVGGVPKSVQTSNLTPDATGIMGYNATQVATAITTAKDKNSATICGMRALANMTTSDATDIGTYLLGIPPVANAITATCQLAVKCRQASARHAGLRQHAVDLEIGALELEHVRGGGVARGHLASVSRQAADPRL